MCVAWKLLLVLIFWIVLNDFPPTEGLRDVHLTLPRYVKSGDSKVLTCHYILEQENLYRIIWYKDGGEFYRFNSNDSANAQMFSLREDIAVDKSRSVGNTVVLSSLRRNGSGVYSCAVETDAPDSASATDSVRMDVIDVPEIGPAIIMDDRLYYVGDNFEANCTINLPPTLVNLTWLINGQELLINNQTAHIINTDLKAAQSYSKETNQFDGETLIMLDKDRVTSHLKLKLLSKHFTGGKLKLECRAKTFDIYQRTIQKNIQLASTSEQVLEFDQPNSAENDILNSNDINYKGRNRRSDEYTYNNNNESSQSRKIHFPRLIGKIVFGGIAFVIGFIFACCKKMCGKTEDNEHLTNAIETERSLVPDPNENERRFVIVHPT